MKKNNAKVYFLIGLSLLVASVYYNGGVLPLIYKLAGSPGKNVSFGEAHNFFAPDTWIPYVINEKGQQKVLGFIPYDLLSDIKAKETIATYMVPVEGDYETVLLLKMREKDFQVQKDIAKNILEHGGNIYEEEGIVNSKCVIRNWTCYRIERGSEENGSTISYLPELSLMLSIPKRIISDKSLSDMEFE